MFKPSQQSTKPSGLATEGSSPRSDAAAAFARLREECGPAVEAPVSPIRPMPPAPLLNQKLTETKFILLDTETTSAEPSTTNIIEVAARGWSLNKGVTFPRVFESKVNPGPGIKIPPSSSAVHHITDSDVANSPLLAEVVPLLMEVVGDYPLVAYNSEFDRCALHPTPLHDRYWLDIYRLAMRTWHIGEENADGFALTSFKQQELRYWLGLRHTEGDAHRAAADIMVTGLVFQEAASRYLEAGLPDDFNAFVDWVASPILHKTIPIGMFGTTGKTPDQLEDWQLKKMFDPDNHMRATLERFNILDFVRPEHMRRQGSGPRRPGR